MHIDRQHRHGRFVASGRLLPEEAAELAVGALGAAAAEDLRTLILNFKDVTPTRVLSLIECHGIGERLARAGAGLERVAVVLRGDCGAAHAHLVTVALNRGLHVATFENESEALAWLQTRG